MLSRPVSVENLLACYEHLQNAPMCIICHVRNNTAGFVGDQCSRVCYTIVPATAACIASMAGPDAPWVKLPDGPVELSSADEAQAVRLGHIGSLRIAMMASHAMLCYGGTATNLADMDGAALAHLSASDVVQAPVSDDDGGSPAGDICDDQALRCSCHWSAPKSP